MHAPEGAWFVDGFLLKALSLSEGEVLVSSELEPGAVIVREIERGALSRALQQARATHRYYSLWSLYQSKA